MRNSARHLGLSRSASALRRGGETFALAHIQTSGPHSCCLTYTDRCIFPRQKWGIQSLIVAGVSDISSPRMTSYYRARNCSATLVLHTICEWPDQIHDKVPTQADRPSGARHASPGHSYTYTSSAPKTPHNSATYAWKSAAPFVPR